LGPEQGIGRVTAVFFRARFIASIKNFNEASGLLISFQLASRNRGARTESLVQITERKAITVVSLRTKNPAASRGPGSWWCGFLHYLKGSEAEFYLVNHMLSAKEFN
jgi:hypothetical protein